MKVREFIDLFKYTKLKASCDVYGRKSGDTKEEVTFNLFTFGKSRYWPWAHNIESFIIYKQKEVYKKFDLLEDLIRDEVMNMELVAIPSMTISHYINVSSNTGNEFYDNSSKLELVVE